MRKLFFLLVAMLLVSGAAVAQDAPPVFCGDLSEADCAILAQAQTAAMSLSSAAFDLQADFTLSNIPEASGPVTFTLTGNGAFTGDRAFFSSMATDVTAMQDPVAMMSMMVEALRAFDFDLSFTLTLPPEILAETGGEVPESISLQLRFVDGLGYINFDTLAPLLGEDATAMGLTGWAGLDIASLLEALVEQYPEMFQEMEMSGFDPAMYQQFNNPEMMAQYGTITRIDDGSGDTATFETTLDFAALMADPAIMDMMRQQMEAQGQTLSEEELQQAMAIATGMFQNSTFSSTTTIDVNTGYSTSSSINMMFDFTAMVEQMPEGADMSEIPVITINATVNTSQFNEVPEITAPEGANVFPYEQLLAMMSSSMMPGGTVPDATVPDVEVPMVTEEPASGG
jgi:hypothetical protein